MERPDADWEAYLRARFPAYLLPESAATRLSVDEAACFMEGLTGRTGELELIQAASFLAPRAAALATFVSGPLLDLVARLPSRTERVRREWEGGYHGRLHIRETVALRLAGRAASFVTLSHRRAFDLPENILVCAVCERLLETLVLLRERNVLRDDSGWGAALRGCEAKLRRLLAASALREVPHLTPSVFDENAARTARHPAYHEAAAWMDAMRTELDDQDPENVAKTVAAGALLPLSDATRFELATLIRLADAFRAALEAAAPGRWREERALVIRGREDVFAFVGDNKNVVRLYFNRAVLPSGQADLGGRHYLGNQGRLRPDVTAVVEKAGVHADAFVIECKHSRNLQYLLSGFHEAVLYRWEYADHLRGRIKAALVTSGAVPADVRDDDEVVATGWKKWPPEVLVRQLVETAT